MTTLQQPLSEGALAEVAMTMRSLRSVERHIEGCLGELWHCKVAVDLVPFRQALHYLDQSHDALSQQVVQHLDALDAQKQSSLTGSAVAQ